MEILRCSESGRSKVDFDQLEFGKTFTDHMVEATFEHGQWGEMKIKPLEPLVMHPGSHVLHYGQAIFEGLKAYRTQGDEVNLFRVRDNISRLNRSAARMAMPELNEGKVLEAITAWMELERDWVPGADQGTLYLRPFVISTSTTLRAMPSDQYKFMLIGSPVGFYYDEPIRVKVESHFRRAAQGGVGFAKAAGNYAAAFMPAQKARDEGFDQLIWTDNSSHQHLEELGSANVFILADGVLYTPQLHDSILAGITRDSVLKLAEHLGIKAYERSLSLDFLREQLRIGKVEAVFATGTAASITFIKEIQLDDTLYEVPVDASDVKRIDELMSGIKYGRTEDPFQWNYLV